MKPVQPPVYLLAALALQASLHYELPMCECIAYPWSLLGLLPLAGGVVLNLLADAAFKRRGTTVSPFQKSEVLITDGVFRLSRYPMYLGMALILLGVAILLGSASPFAVVPVFALTIDRRFISVEQRRLEDTFGTSFRQYRERVRRWL
jgi:protein-S-isoprenylcysteine O-methyltransferase Ste14